MTTSRLFRIAFGLLAGLCLCGFAKSAEQGSSLNPLRTIGKVTLKGFLERPLFDPARRLPPVLPPIPVAVAAPVVTPPEPPPTLHLLGVIQGEREMAVVQRDGEAKTVILGTGDHIGGWTVTVLPSASIKLASGDRSVNYAMFTKVAGATSTAVAQNNDVDRQVDMSAAIAARNERLRRRTY